MAGCETHVFKYFVPFSKAAQVWSLRYILNRYHHLVLWGRKNKSVVTLLITALVQVQLNMLLLSTSPWDRSPERLWTLWAKHCSGLILLRGGCWAGPLLTLILELVILEKTSKLHVCRHNIHFCWSCLDIAVGVHGTHLHVKPAKAVVKYFTDGC